MTDSDSQRTARLTRAEQDGLRLAILCRTLALAVMLAWFVFATLAVGNTPRPWGMTALGLFVVIGAAYYFIIGTHLDRPWVKYLIYAVDMLGLCALFVLIPVSRAAEVPQIIAFRAYGIYYLLPPIALACLSLSWGLVAWTGVVACIGWWAAFAVVVAGMDWTLSWGDVPQNATRADYETVFLSIDFIGVGNRVEETGFLLMAALVLSLAVYRARRVFLAQVAAEAEREREREGRERTTRILGRYVPETIARRLVANEAGLEPQVRQGAALVLDIEGFSGYAAGRDPRTVIETLNRFLADCADAVSRRDGVVITYLGDGLLATFNTPIDVQRPGRRALDAAGDLLALSRERRYDGQHFRIRIGIASGAIASGSVGSSARQAFTVYGDPVNRAARLEQLNKTTGTQLLLDPETANALGAEVDLQSQGRHTLRGRDAPVEVWSPT